MKCSLIAVIVSALSYVYSDAQPTIIDNIDDVHELTTAAIFIVDTSRLLSVDDVRLMIQKGGGNPASGEIRNFTGTNGAIWFKADLKSHLDEGTFVSFSSLFFEHIDIYRVSPEGSELIKSSGYLRPMATRDIVSKNYIFRLAKKGECVREACTFYIRINSNVDPPMLISAKVGSVRAIVGHSRLSEFISVAVLGIIFVMLFYNLCLYLVIRDSLYLFYCFYIIGALFCVLWFTGYMVEWFSPIRDGDRLYPWQMGLFYLSQLMFVNRLLNVRVHFKLGYQFSLFVMVCSIAIFLFSTVLKINSTELILITGLAIPLYFIGTSVRLIFLRIQMAKIFLLGWLPLLAVTALNILMTADVLSYNAMFDIHAVEIALAWELVIFSLALGYRYNTLRREKMEMQAENIRIMKEQKALLRKMVFEQTEEIMAQNDQLLRNQEEIKLQNERLEAQNTANEQLREMVIEHNHRLEAAVQRRTVELAQSNEELRRHYHQLEQFSFIAAHHLRAPVARILGLVSIIDNRNPLSPDNATVLEKIVASAKDLDTIVHDLGSILEARQRKVDKFETINPMWLVDRVVHQFQKEIMESGINVQVSIEIEAMVTIPAYIESILANLVSNSIKYRDNKRALVIKIDMREYGDEYAIVVSDNGLGFDSEKYSTKLFEPFQRFHSHKGGKGLGMFLIKTQVLAMNGRISLTSRESFGTEVEIRIPKVQILELQPE